MGAHPKAPSIARSDDGGIALSELIGAEPAKHLGDRCAARFEGRLPYLFKVLAAAKPLSIQAHPDLDQAREGWERENWLGIPLDAPNRNYKDANHKPEIICALTPFTALCGFRTRDTIRRLFDLLGYSGLDKIVAQLNQEDDEKALRGFFSGIFSLSETDRAALGRFVGRRAAELAEANAKDAQAWRLTAAFARATPTAGPTAGPTDPAILAPLYLNVLTLQRGEAIFLPAGILHAYVEGFGVELMANSDNVLRGGLTVKHVDLSELLRILRFQPFSPRVVEPQSIDGRTLRSYPSPAPEFALDAYEGRSAVDSAHLIEGTPTILIVTEGSLSYRDDSGTELALAKGQSAFISAAARRPVLSGNGKAYLARVPTDVRSLPS
jgi:mannose-6-phosphate isomerase